MKLMSEYIGEKIWFVQPSVWKRIHELRINDELVGSFRQVGFFGMKWEVSMLNKNWEIYRPSIWRTSWDIREAGYELPIANFTKDRFKDRGTISLPLGVKIKIVPHLFKGFCEIINEREDCLVKITPKKISIKDKAEVTIEKKDVLLDKYPWTIILAYIISLEQKHRAAHSTP